MTPDSASDLELALSMADTADAITMAHFLSLDLVIDTKPASKLDRRLHHLPLLVNHGV